MIARQTKFQTFVNLILGGVWFTLAIFYFFIEGDKLGLGFLYVIVSVGYLLMSVYSFRYGFIRIENGEIVKCEFMVQPKRIKIDEINWANCTGSYYTFKSKKKKLAIELANVHKDDIAAFEKVFKEIVMRVPPYKRA